MSWCKQNAIRITICCVGFIFPFLECEETSLSGSTTGSRMKPVDDASFGAFKQVVDEGYFAIDDAPAPADQQQQQFQIGEQQQFQGGPQWGCASAPAATAFQPLPWTGFPPRGCAWKRDRLGCAWKRLDARRWRFVSSARWRATSAAR